MKKRVVFYLCISILFGNRDFQNFENKPLLKMVQGILEKEKGEIGVNNIFSNHSQSFNRNLLRNNPEDLIGTWDCFKISMTNHITSNVEQTIPNPQQVSGEIPGNGLLEINGSFETNLNYLAKSPFSSTGVIVSNKRLSWIYENDIESLDFQEPLYALNIVINEYVQLAALEILSNLDPTTGYFDYNFYEMDFENAILNIDYDLVEIDISQLSYLENYDPIDFNINGLIFADLINIEPNQVVDFPIFSMSDLPTFQFYEDGTGNGIDYSIFDTELIPFDWNATNDSLWMNFNNEGNSVNLSYHSNQDSLFLTYFIENYCSNEETDLDECFLEISEITGMESIQSISATQNLDFEKFNPETPIIGFGDYPDIALEFNSTEVLEIFNYGDVQSELNWSINGTENYPWIIISGLSGILNGGGQGDTLFIELNSEHELSEGFHSAYLEIESNDPNYSEVELYISYYLAPNICIQELIEINGEQYCSEDIEFLQMLIDNSLETLDVGIWDVNNNGVIEPLELGEQWWLDYKLFEFFCGGCGLSGEIPNQISNLHELRYLTIWENQFEGEIPPLIGNLNQLISLNLRDNLLTGQIPNSIWELQDLTWLYLDRNNLEGTIPSEVGILTNLIELTLFGNNLTGEIPSTIGNLTNLELLDLDYNQLTGNIPTEIGNLVNLHTLWLDNNQLSGWIPNEIGNLVNLNILQLHDNQLSGLIPEEICNLNFESLDYNFNDNNFCEPYPPCISWINSQDCNYYPNCPEDYSALNEYCFNDDNLGVIQDIINANQSLEGLSPIEVGNQNWDSGLLTSLNMSNLGLDSLPSNICNLDNSYLTANNNNLCEQFHYECINIWEQQLCEDSNCASNFSSENVCYDDGHINFLIDMVSINDTLSNYHLLNIGLQQWQEGSLTSLAISQYNLDSLSSHVGELQNLSSLNLSNNQLEYLPESICNIPESCFIRVDNNLLCEDSNYDCIDYWGNQDCQLSLTSMEIPKEFHLSLAYPNPFNPKTTFNFELPIAEFVEIQIYNLNGKIVKELFSSHLNAGYYTIEWNADNFPSGIYFIKLSSGTYNQIQKVTLMK